MDNNLLNMFKSTYGGAVRDREAAAADLRAKQASASLNEASALESMFRTKRGEQMLPSEVATANFEASPAMQQAKLGKSQAEAAKLKAESDKAIMELSDDQIVQVYKQGIAVNKNILASAQSYLAAGYSVKDALAAISASLPEDKRNDPKFRQLIAQYSRMNPKQAAALIDQGLTQISEAEAKATDPNYIRQILTGKQQAEQEHIRGGYSLAGDKIRANTSKDTKPTAAQFTLAQIKSMFPNETDAQIAERFLQYQKGSTTTEENPFVPGMVDKRSKEASGLAPRTSSTQQDPNLAKLPKGSKALGNGVYQLPDGRKVRAN